MDKKEFWGWWSSKNKEQTFTLAEVSELMDQIKVFNCGAIDQYLTNHCDKAFKEWADSKKEG